MGQSVAASESQASSPRLLSTPSLEPIAVMEACFQILFPSLEYVSGKAGPRSALAFSPWGACSGLCSLLWLIWVPGTEWSRLPG